MTKYELNDYKNTPLQIEIGYIKSHRKIGMFSLK